MSATRRPLLETDEHRLETKRDLAYRVLKTAISTCDLQPGTRLVIESLARELRISAIPVREALQMLQSEGLIISTPHAGAVVSPIDVESIVEVFTALEGLETAVARRAVERADAVGLENLADVTAQMDAVISAGRFEDWADLNQRFHLGISKLAALPMMLQMTTRVFARWDRVRRYFFNRVLLHRVGQAQQEHRQIIAALTERDVERLEWLLRQHNRGALVAYMTHLEAAEGPAKPRARRER